MLLDLLLITAYYLPESSRSVAATDTFGIILLVLPFVYCIFYVSVFIIKKLRLSVYLCICVCNVYAHHRLKFSSKVQISKDDAEIIAFNEHASVGEDEKSSNRADDNSYYHEFRDELLIIDSIIQ